MWGAPFIRTRSRVKKDRFHSLAADPISRYSWGEGPEAHSSARSNRWTVKHGLLVGVANQIFRQERDGGYLSAPKSGAGGVLFPHWSNVTLVQPGDVIF